MTKILKFALAEIFLSLETKVAEATIIEEKPGPKENSLFSGTW